MAWLCPVFMNMFIPEHPISELSANIMHKPNIWQETTLNIYCLSIGKYRVKTFRFVVKNVTCTNIQLDSFKFYLLEFSFLDLFLIAYEAK